MAVSEILVREFFELHGFLVHQRRKHVAPAARQEDEIDFYVQNPRPVTAQGPMPILLASTDLAHLDRALVVVKAWHTETLTRARMTSKAEFVRPVQPAMLRHAAQFFGDVSRLTKVLVVPSLSHDPDERDSSLELLRSKGVDAVVLFRTVLADLVGWTNPSRNYRKSDLLQTIRIFKHYDFFREAQMELFRPPPVRRRSRSESPPPTPGST